MSKLKYHYTNFRYNNGEIVMIDVSQAVEHEHPYALEFLRKDCTNITGRVFFILFIQLFS